MTQNLEDSEKIDSKNSDGDADGIFPSAEHTAVDHGLEIDNQRCCLFDNLDLFEE